jgi:hypothetical protein
MIKTGCTEPVFSGLAATFVTLINYWTWTGFIKPVDKDYRLEVE